ncbi:MAG TPA: hypothetical protein VLB32_04110 [Candidatus Acidoferrales bacterium]|nr:hypothetical protein [Candidatus Acidoferrales bacterium]
MSCVLVLAVLFSCLAGAQQQRRTLRDWAKQKGYVWTTYGSDVWFGPKNLDELVERTNVIILGRVMEERTRLSTDEQMVITDYIVEVLDVVKSEDSSILPGGSLTVSKIGGNLLLEGRPVRMDTPGSPPIPWIQPHLFLLSKLAPDNGLYVGSSTLSVFAVKDEKLVCSPSQADDRARKELCGKSINEALQVLKQRVAEHFKAGKSQ